jgi:hypothetical protein
LRPIGSHGGKSENEDQEKRKSPHDRIVARGLSLRNQQNCSCRAANFGCSRISGGSCRIVEKPAQSRLQPKLAALQGDMRNGLKTA